MNTAHARSMPRVVRAAVWTLRWRLVAVLGRYFIENFMILVYDQRVGRDAPRPAPWLCLCFCVCYCCSPLSQAATVLISWVPTTTTTALHPHPPAETRFCWPAAPENCGYVLWAYCANSATQAAQARCCSCSRPKCWRKSILISILATCVSDNHGIATDEAQAIPRIHLRVRDLTGDIQNHRRNTALSSSKMFFEERLCPSSKSPWLRRYNHQPASVTTWKLLQLFFSSQNAAH